MKKFLKVKWGEPGSVIGWFELRNEYYIPIIRYEYNTYFKPQDIIHWNENGICIDNYNSNKTFYHALHYKIFDNPDKVEELLGRNAILYSFDDLLDDIELLTQLF